LIDSSKFGDVYCVKKSGIQYSMRAVKYENNEEKSRAAKEQQIFTLLRGSCPYLLNFIESFESV
jgi:hypothetical protein